MFNVDDKVEKFTGEARWNGVIRARYTTTKGKLRYVVEVEPQGFQMIAVPEQLRLRDELYPGDYGDWVEWEGGENPVPGCRVEYLLRRERTHLSSYNRCQIPSDMLRWTHASHAGDIVAYRVVDKPWYPDNKPGWVEWTGGANPVPFDTKVNVLFRQNRKMKDSSTAYACFYARIYCWTHDGVGSDIVAYRVVKPWYPDNEDGWTEWVESGVNPVPGKKVYVLQRIDRDNEEENYGSPPLPSEIYSWSNTGDWDWDIVAYRVVED